METNIRYGIQKCTVGEDAIESTYVKFGDGLTRISTVAWDDKLAGIQICRIEGENEKFKTHKGKGAEIVNNLPDLEKVYFVFDSEKSIDVMIARLTEAKGLINSSDHIQQSGVVRFDFKLGE